MAGRDASIRMAAEHAQTDAPTAVATRERPGPAPLALAPEPHVDPDQLRAHWYAAFESARAALQAAALYLPAQELGERGKHLSAEREPTAHLLDDLARDEHVTRPPVRLPASRREARELLGLSGATEACIFTLDGVLIPSAELHVAAWTETFDAFLSARAERTGGEFALFNPRTDYPAHIHARPRLDGVRGFLASRGISLPEGSPDDPPDAETVHGLANRKNEALQRRLAAHGVAAYAGSWQYLELAREGGVARAVVSASANTEALLAGAGLTDLVDVSIDGNALAAEGLRPRPAPDALLAACRRLGVVPAHAAAFETSVEGVAAAREAGFGVVVGVDRHAGEAMRAAGADRVVTGLDELLHLSGAA